MRGISTARGFGGAMLVFFLLAAAGRAEWLRVTTPGFEVYTNTGEKTGRLAAEKLEQIRHVFAGAAEDADRPRPPLKVYIFRSAAEYNQYRPTSIARGFYRGSPEADYIVMHRSSGGDPWRVAFHEYVHLVLNHTIAHLPKWFEEGTAEFYSTVKPEGDRLIIGRQIPGHLSTLRRRPWLEAEELAAVDHDSPESLEGDRTGIFYAQSWALAHMLNLDPEYRSGLPEYFTLLAERIPPDEAFLRSFGRTLTEAVEDLRRYYPLASWKTVEAGWTPPEEVAVEVAALDEREAAMVTLELQLSLGKWDVSEKTLRKLALEKGESTEVETARALVALSRKDMETARAHFEKSIALGSRAATTYFEYAVLLNELGAEPERVRELLLRTVELNPLYADAHFLLASRASGEGRHPDAIEPLERATALLPRRSIFWHALAIAYYRTGRLQDARSAARTALDTARTPPETEMARAVVQMASGAPPEARRDDRPPVTTPKSWYNRTGDSRVEGVLERIECQGDRAILHIAAAGETTALLVSDPAKVVLKNSTGISFEFACGTDLRTQVAVEYAARPNADTATAGEVTAIEFK